MAPNWEVDEDNFVGQCETVFNNVEGAKTIDDPI